MPYDINPYFKKNAASANYRVDWAIVGAAVGMGLWAVA